MWTGYNQDTAENSQYIDSIIDGLHNTSNPTNIIDLPKKLDGWEYKSDVTDKPTAQNMGTDGAKK